MKRKALGKGLSALLPDPEPAQAEGGALSLPLESLDPNPYQLRERMDPQRLAELAEEKAANPMLDDGVVAKRRATLSEAYERVRDAINTTETRFEKLEF